MGVNGSESLVEQNTQFDKFLKKIASADNTRNSLIIGDINVNMNDNHDHNNHVQSDLKDKLLNLLPSEGFTQVIKKNTRHSSCSQPSLIDHVWLNNLTKLEQVRNIESDSDHDLISVKLKIKGRVHNSENTYTRNYSNFDKNYF